VVRGRTGTFRSGGHVFLGRITDLKGACRLLSQGPTWSITINRLNQRTNTMEQKETQNLKHKLLLNGVSMLAAAVAVAAAVGQQGRSTWCD
jgi:hypothetical protein